MKTSDQWYTSINSIESPIEQADHESRSTRLQFVQSKASSSMEAIQRQRKRLLPLFIGSALISSMSLLGLLAFLLSQSPSFIGPRPSSTEVNRDR